MKQHFKLTFPTFPFWPPYPVNNPIKIIEQYNNTILENNTIIAL